MNRNIKLFVCLSFAVTIAATFLFSEAKKYQGLFNNPILKENIEVLSRSEGSRLCSSGGAGATSCSYEYGGFSCSVSCESGYYACCGLSGCTCKRN